MKMIKYEHKYRYEFARKDMSVSMIISEIMNMSYQFVGKFNFEKF